MQIVTAAVLWLVLRTQMGSDSAILVAGVVWLFAGAWRWWRASGEEAIRLRQESLRFGDLVDFGSAADGVDYLKMTILDHGVFASLRRQPEGQWQYLEANKWGTKHETDWRPLPPLLAAKLEDGYLRFEREFDFRGPGTREHHEMERRWFARARQTT